MIRSRMLRQFFLWYLLFVAIPALVLATYAYYNVQTYAKNEMQATLSFDLERAASANDRMLQTAQRSMQTIIGSQEVYRVATQMRQNIAQGKISNARYLGEYELRALLKPILFSESDIADVLFFMDDSCVFSYANYVPAQQNAQIPKEDTSEKKLSWTGNVQNPYGIFGNYLMLRGTMRDFSSWEQNELCTIIILLRQQDVIDQLTANTRYEDTISVLLEGQSILVLAGGEDFAEALKEQAAALQSLAQWPDVSLFRVGDQTTSMSVYKIASAIDGLYYLQLSPTFHVFAYASSVLMLVVGWAILAVLALIIYALLMSRRIIRPTMRLAAAMKGLTADKLENHLSLPCVNNELVDAYEGYNSMVMRLKNSFEQVRISEKEKRHYQLAMLKYQINPHFLYNTINSVRFSCLENGDVDSADMLVTLSRLLRNTLSSPSEMIPLAQEINNLKDYIALQQIRYDYGLEFQWGNTQDTDTLLVPMMILQPIVENAITHGLSSALNLGGEACVRIDAFIQDQSLFLQIEDNGKGIEEAELKTLLDMQRVDANRSSQIGLANIHHRIQLMFGRAYGLSIESEIGRFTRVTLKLPQVSETEEREGADRYASGYAGR